MRHRTFRIHIACVVLLAVFSQAFSALAAPCGSVGSHLSMMAPASMSDMSDMHEALNQSPDDIASDMDRDKDKDKAGHDMGHQSNHHLSMDHSSVDNADCCQDSLCAKAGCAATVAALVDDRGQPLISKSPTHYSAYAVYLQGIEPSSPFRPPISH